MQIILSEICLQPDRFFSCKHKVSQIPVMDDFELLLLSMGKHINSI